MFARVRAGWAFASVLGTGSQGLVRPVWAQDSGDESAGSSAQRQRQLALKATDGVYARHAPMAMAQALAIAGPSAVNAVNAARPPVKPLRQAALPSAFHRKLSELNAEQLAARQAAEDARHKAVCHSFVCKVEEPGKTPFRLTWRNSLHVCFSLSTNLAEFLRLRRDSIYS